MNEQPPCLYPGCERPMEPHLLLCSAHWKYLPTSLCCRLWRFYVPGVEVEPDLNEGFARALAVAVAHIRAKEFANVPLEKSVY